MAISLDTTGLIPESVEDKKESNSRHVSKRKPIALNFSNAQKPHGTSLAYWQKHKLATPLFWCILDALAIQPDPEDPDQVRSVKDVIDNMSSEEYAENLLKKLRK